jgi:hypothetical protein
VIEQDLGEEESKCKDHHDHPAYGHVNQAYSPLGLGQDLFEVNVRVH